MRCEKSYFTNQNSYAIRLTTMAFEVVGGGASFTLNRNLPFVPLAWMPGAGGPPADITLSSTASQNTYRFLLESIVPGTALANGSYPDAGAAGDFGGVTCNLSLFVNPNYFIKYLGPVLAGAWTQEGSYADNYNTHRMPGAMVSQFWADENAAPVPSTLMTRLYGLVETIKTQTDPRLWAPPGQYTFDGAFSGFSGAQTLAAAFADAAIGNTLGLAFLAMEIKSIE